MEEEKKELYIPTNCPPLDYVVAGFTGIDLTYIGVCVLIAIVISIKIGISSGNLVKSLLFVLAVAGISLLFFHRDKYGENSLDKIRIEINYFKSTKEYLYEYVDVYEKLSKKSRVEKKNEGKNRAKESNSN